MGWEIHQMLTAVHIFLAIMWVGGLLFIGWGVYPAISYMKYTQQQQFLYMLMKRVHSLFTLAGAGVIITGLLLGTALGPIKSWNALWNTSYGNTWLAALIVAIFTLLWGIFAGYQQAMKVLTDDNLWQLADGGYTQPLKESMIKIAALEAVEGLGFVSLIILMVFLA